MPPLVAALFTAWGSFRWAVNTAPTNSRYHRFPLSERQWRHFPRRPVTARVREAEKARLAEPWPEDPGSSSPSW
jgi:hypothetical protein